MGHNQRVSFDDEVWERLVDSLERWGAVGEDPDGHLAVAGPHFKEARARVIIVMTRGDWSDLVSITCGASDTNVEAAIGRCADACGRTAGPLGIPRVRQIHTRAVRDPRAGPRPRVPRFAGTCSAAPRGHSGRRMVRSSIG